jgi:hypothetical protein
MLGLALALVAGVQATASATLIADWKFDAGNFLADSSANGHTLTVAPVTSTPGGGAGVGFDNSATSYTADSYTNPNNQTGSTASASFDGTDALITTNTLGLNGYSQLTIEWFEKSTSSTSELYPWFSGNPSSINGAPGDFSWASQGTFRDFGAANTSTSVPLNQWHEYAVTLDTTPIGSGGTGITLYKDYAQVDHISVAAHSFNDSTFVLGKDYYGGGERHFQGQLDEVSISSGILTPSEFVSTISSVPEPSSVVMLGLGIVGLCIAAKHRRRS